MLGLAKAALLAMMLTPKEETSSRGYSYPSGGYTSNDLYRRRPKKKRGKAKRKVKDKIAAKSKRRNRK